MEEGEGMSDNKPPKAIWVRHELLSRNAPTPAYTQRKAHCISYIEPAQFMADVMEQAHYAKENGLVGNEYLWAIRKVMGDFT